MTTANFDNCSRCGKIFQKFFSSLCADCYAYIQNELERCTQYLKKNQDSTIEEVSQGTDVSIRKIIQFINEGKLYASDYPNLNYECYFCTQKITRGYLCKDCAFKIKLEVKHLLLEDGYEFDMESNQIKAMPKKSGPGKKPMDTYTVEGRKGQ